MRRWLIFKIFGLQKKSHYAQVYKTSDLPCSILHEFLKPYLLLDTFGFMPRWVTTAWLILTPCPFIISIVFLKHIQSATPQIFFSQFKQWLGTYRRVLKAEKHLGQLFNSGVITPMRLSEIPLIKLHFEIGITTPGTMSKRVSIKDI